MTMTVQALAELIALLDLDEAYDEDPQGDPPLWLARYRAAVRAAILVGPHGPRGDKALSPDAIDAYRAGQADALDAVIRAVATQLMGAAED